MSETPSPPAFRCPICGRASANAGYASNRFCAVCGFVDDPIGRDGKLRRPSLAALPDAEFIQEAWRVAHLPDTTPTDLALMLGLALGRLHRREMGK